MTTPTEAERVAALQAEAANAYAQAQAQQQAAQDQLAFARIHAQEAASTR